MNKATKTKMENKFDLFSIDNVQLFSGENYKMSFDMVVAKTAYRNITKNVVVKKNETITKAIERVLSSNKGEVK